MKLLCKSIVLLWTLNYFSIVNLCIISNSILNCTGLNLTDCPPVNHSIYTLILDDNLLENFDSNNCQNWTRYDHLSIKRNNLKSFSINNKFNLLQYIDLSQNKLTSINLELTELNTFIISHNYISEKIKFKFVQLKHLIINNNLINNKGLENIISQIHLSPSLSKLDVSHNKFDDLPSSFMSLNGNSRILVNFSGNSLKTFTFSGKLKHGVDYDLSFNQIVDFTAYENNFVYKLNLSHNKLANIDDISKLSRFIILQELDLSANPLNCLCNESQSFIQWMMDNKNKIVNKNKTICEKPDKKSIFDVKCTNGSLSTTPSIITSTTHQVHPTIEHTPVWKIIVPIFIILFVGFVIIIYLKCRRSSGYQRVGESPISSPLFGCECLQMLRIPPRRNSGLFINQDENTQHSFNEGRLNFEDNLNVICSSKDRKWITSNITSHLSIKKTIISSKVKNLPFGDFTLIVVNGDSCFNDNAFVNNIDKSLNTNIQTDIRLLIKEMPDFEKCRENWIFIDFLKEKIGKNAYFQFNSNDNDTCLSNLKFWLKLDFIHHDV